MRRDGVWVVSSIKNEYNHDLNLDIIKLMSTHRKLNPNIKRTLIVHDITGIKPCKSVWLLEVQSGGLKNLGCLTKDMRNCIENQMRLRLGYGNVEAIRKMFMRMQQIDGVFFHSIDVDDKMIL